MKRYEIGMIALAAGLLVCASARAADPSTRGLKICVAADAPEPVRRAAETILAAAKTHPLLAILCGPRGAPSALTDTRALLAAKPEARAFDHLVVIGMPGDPLIDAAGEHEARATAGGLYLFGFGYLTGDVGYVESDRNPFLHGSAIPKAPYETELVTITGSTPEGVALAAEAFLKQGLINGVVAAPKWQRPTPTLLDRDPLSPDFTPPDGLPLKIGAAPRIGLSQAGEDEYRGVLEDTGVEPVEIWRAKFYLSGAWDGAGSDKAFENYSFGLHRRAYGNTLWCARFATPAQAADAAPRIAAAAKLKKTKSGWSGAQPPYSSEKQSAGPLSLWQHGSWVLMSTLPEKMSDEARDALR